jgi:hypothetical protein
VAHAVLERAAMVTVVADAESDIYDQFARCPAGLQLLSRAAQDRALAGGAGGAGAGGAGAGGAGAGGAGAGGAGAGGAGAGGRRLFAQAAAWPEQERHAIAVPGRGARPARTATVALRFGEVTLRRPQSAARGLRESVTLRVVDVTESEPPPAGEPPLRWCLLTTHAVHSADDARRIVAWYQARWTIEQVFRALKSAGLRAEESQVTEARRFIKLVVAGLIAAVRVMQIVIGRDGATGQALADAADPADQPMLAAFNARLQGRTAKLRNPHPDHTLAWFAWIVARLGGWSGYSSAGYKPAGPKTIARGLRKLDAMSQGWELAHSAHVRLP